jgi:hypothetical protein
VILKWTLDDDGGGEGNDPHGISRRVTFGVPFRN